MTRRTRNWPRASCATLGNLYLEKTVDVHRPPGAFEFFQAESQHYDQQLQAAQAQLAKFDRDKGVTDPQLEKQIALQKLSEFEATFNATQVAIKETEKRTRVVEEQLASTPAADRFPGPRVGKPISHAATQDHAAGP